MRTSKILVRFPVATALALALAGLVQAAEGAHGTSGTVGTTEPACHAGPATSARLAPQAPQAPQVLQTASLPERTSSDSERWVRLANKHNGSGIRVAYVAPKTLAVGEAGRVEILLSGATEANAQVRLRAPAGARLVDSEGSDIGLVSLPAGQITQLTLLITPVQDGSQTIDVFTEQAGRSSAQSIRLPVGTGASALKSMGSAKMTPQGERVISLPAQTER